MGREVSPNRFVRFVRGHAVGDTFYRFPHDCPGTDCAIKQWIGDQALREAIKDRSPESVVRRAEATT